MRAASHLMVVGQGSAWSLFLVAGLMLGPCASTVGGLRWLAVAGSEGGPVTHNVGGNMAAPGP